MIKSSHQILHSWPNCTCHTVLGKINIVFEVLLPAFNLTENNEAVVIQCPPLTILCKSFTKSIINFHYS